MPNIECSLIAVKMSMPPQLHPPLGGTESLDYINPVAGENRPSNGEKVANPLPKVQTKTSDRDGNYKNYINFVNFKNSTGSF